MNSNDFKKSEYFQLYSGFNWVYFSFILPIILLAN